MQLLLAKFMQSASQKMYQVHEIRAADNMWHRGNYKFDKESTETQRQMFDIIVNKGKKRRNRGE